MIHVTKRWRSLGAEAGSGKRESVLCGSKVAESKSGIPGVTYTRDNWCDDCLDALSVELSKPMPVSTPSTVRYIYEVIRSNTLSSLISSGRPMEDSVLAHLCSAASSDTHRVALWSLHSESINNPLYVIWTVMIERCYNPTNWASDDWHGFTVCDRWMSFKNFVADAPDGCIGVFPGSSDVIGPSSCIWQTREGGYFRGKSDNDLGYDDWVLQSYPTLSKICSKCLMEKDLELFLYLGDRTYSDRCEACSAITNNGLKERTYDEVLTDRDRLRPDGVKKCRVCRESLPFVSFYSSLSSPDGLVASCKRCCKESPLLNASLRGGIVELLTDEQGYECRYPGCDEKSSLHVDHVISLRCGGSDSIDNYQFLCGFHNISKGKKCIDYRGDTPKVYKCPD